MWVKIALALALLTGLDQARSDRASSAPGLPTGAAEVARNFLFAYAKNDRAAMKAMLPKSLENLYGPSPFTRMPQLANPRVDERVGAIDFECPMIDRSLPTKGTIVLRYVQEEGVTAWRVRQIYWYQELPTEANHLPDKSKTASDRQREPGLRQTAMAFIRAWNYKQYQELDNLTFHWWEIHRRPPKWAKMNDVELTSSAIALGGLRVDFDARLRIMGMLPKRVRGTIWLVNEEGAWYVRPLTFVFMF